jgi:hypothetical protein
VSDLKLPTSKERCCVLRILEDPSTKLNSGEEDGLPTVTHGPGPCSNTKISTVVCANIEKRRWKSGRSFRALLYCTVQNFGLKNIIREVLHLVP